MNLFISTNLLNPRERECIFPLLDKWRGRNLGIEIFPHFYMDEYCQILDGCIGRLKNVPVSFHGPYHNTEHSRKKETKEYRAAMDYCKMTFAYAAKLGGRHIVFHYNNCPVTAETRENMLLHAGENLTELTELAKMEGLKLLVENTGISALGNVLFDEDEFIELFDNIPHNCLFDVGHAHCNCWDIENVLRELNHRTVCYHLHNNYRKFDEHNRIMDGTLDMGMIFDLYNLYTPDADIVIEYRSDLLENPEQIEEDIKLIQDNVKMQGVLI